MTSTLGRYAMCSTGRLPVELSTKVLSWLSLQTNRHNVLRLRLVCFAFDQIVQTIVFETAVIYPSHAVGQIERVPTIFGDYLHALTRNAPTPRLHGEAFRDLTLKGGHFIPRRAPTLHQGPEVLACTLLRIVEQLPRLKNLTLVTMQLAPCDHDSPCSRFTGSSRKHTLQILRLIDVLIFPNANPARVDHFAVTEYLTPTTYSLESCVCGTSNDELTYPAFPAPALVVNRCEDGILAGFKQAKDTHEFSFWPGGLILRQWDEAKRVVENNIHALKKVRLGVDPVAGPSIVTRRSVPH